MSVQVVENQNVVMVEGKDFNDRNLECTWDDRVYCQPVRYDIDTQFIIKTSGVDGFNLVSNGNFDTDLTDWTESGGVFAWSSGTALADNDPFIGTGTLTQTISGLTSGETYKLIYTITNYSGAGFGIVGTTALTHLSGDISFTANGTYTAYFEASAGSSSLIFQSSFPQTFAVDDVVLIKESVVGTLDVTIEDCDGVTVKTITDIETFGDYNLVTIDWTDVAIGCHRICIDGIGDTEFNYLTGGSSLIQERGGELLLEYCSERPGADCVLISFP